MAFALSCTPQETLGVFVLENFGNRQALLFLQVWHCWKEKNETASQQLLMGDSCGGRAMTNEAEALAPSTTAGGLTSGSLFNLSTTQWGIKILGK